MPCGSLAQGPANADGERHGGRHRNTFCRFAIHAVIDDIGLPAHADGHAAGQPLGLCGVFGLDQHAVAAFVRHRHRACRHAVDVEGFHFKLREGAAHAVRINDGHALLAASTMGIMELMPPASKGMMAPTSMPVWSS